MNTELRFDSEIWEPVFTRLVELTLREVLP